jgi:hypothetical protein
MDELTKQFYEVPKGDGAEKVQNSAAAVLLESHDEIAGIIEKHGIPRDRAEAIAEQVIRQPPAVTNEGSGSIGAMVAIGISLVPLIKVMVPLLEPFSKQGAKLAYNIGMDIWEMIRQKLLEKKSIRLTEKKKKKQAQKK